MIIVPLQENQPNIPNETELSNAIKITMNTINICCYSGSNKGFMSPGDNF